MLAERADEAFAGFKYYFYEPSMAAAVIFILLFLCTTVLHTYQMVRTRTWFLIPFVIGGYFEILGYIGRGMSARQKFDEYTMGPYIMQSILLLVAPALFAASIYMNLGQIVELVNGDKYLPIRRRWLTKTFVLGDILSFIMQGAGGGLMSSGGKSVELGENLIIIGLFVQIVFFGLFLITAYLFHTRTNKGPTAASSSIPWQKYMLALYLSSLLILVRSVFRVVEYLQGYQGYLLKHEIYLYLFDALLMVIAMVIFNIIHPSQITGIVRGGKAARGFAMVDVQPYRAFNGV